MDMAAQKFGRNHGAYHGDTIDIGAILARIKRAAPNQGWRRTESPRPPAPGRPVEFLAYERPAANERLRVYISAGIHGDEPAGPVAVARLIEEDNWPAGISLWFCPCLNPAGFPLNSRANDLGDDLNRDYRSLRHEETLRHAAWLQSAPRFDFCVCLHEDWESSGFYLYEWNRESRPSLASTILQAVAAVCPIDHAEQIDGWTASGGVVHPRIEPRERLEWAEAAFLVTNKTSQSYTLEAPSDFPLETRVTALVTGVRAALGAAAATI
jgi:hypothetical protein